MINVYLLLNCDHLFVYVYMCILGMIAVTFIHSYVLNATEKYGIAAIIIERYNTMCHCFA